MAKILDLNLADDVAEELIDALLGDGVQHPFIAFESVLHPERNDNIGQHLAPASALERYVYWKVNGAKKKALVRAASASEAIERAEEAGLVANWEMATATFIGRGKADV